MKRVAIFIPSLNRPRSIERVSLNLRENTPEDQYELYFILEPEDQSVVVAELYGNVIINQHEPSYAGAIQTAYEQTTEPYFFCGADDLGFAKGWLDQALSHMKNGIMVVGTNDLGTWPIGEKREATHYLINRKYIEKQSGVIDKPNTVLYPYQHNYTDTEFIGTARKRGVYEYCPKSIVEHAHPVWNKALWDETYEKGRRTDPQDKQIYLSRLHLWHE